MNTILPELTQFKPINAQFLSIADQKEPRFILYKQMED